VKTHALFAVKSLPALAVALALLMPPAASASTVQRNTPHITTTITVTTLALPAARCAQLKAAYPSRAHNPRLCQATHIEKRTLSKSADDAAPQPGAASQSCWSGTASFDDNYVEFPGEYSMELNSTFTYSCSVPTSARIRYCNENYAVLGHSISNLGCWTYATSLPSQAAYSQWLVIMPLWAGNYTAWQRRECYAGVPTGSCSWYWG
jgi:hypothetical protein